ncbi:peptidoglycan-binding protein [Christensenellaceae bacterium OttesenSCG-928-L17]|nr:peptidoglycan-binding protein [Christensenellaceae bacterium OttesenSCG-928-L17]
MKKRRIIALMLLLCALIATMPGTLAATHHYDDGGQIVHDEPYAGALVKYSDYGEIVELIQVRLRELDYFYFKPTGKFQSMTRECVIEFQKNQVDENNQPIISDGTVGAQSLTILFSPNAVRAPIAQSIHIPIGKKADGTQTEVGEPTSWETVKEKLEAGTTYTLTDFNTGVTFDMVYIGGENHAEMECASANDTAVYKQTFGDAFNYSKRPMLVQLGSDLVACSLQGAPHGEDGVARNEMDGHACLFFQDSKSHVGQLADREHNNNVRTASGKAG